MFGGAGAACNFGRRGGAYIGSERTFFGTISNTTTRQPFTRGVLLTTLSFVLMLIGGILTWLGMFQVFV